MKPLLIKQVPARPSERTGGEGGRTHLDDVPDDLSSLDQKRHGWPKQAAREVQADLVAVEHGHVVLRRRLPRAARARGGQGAGARG